jgi:hypothetical protein
MQSMVPSFTAVMSTCLSFSVRMGGVTL